MNTPADKPDLPAPDKIAALIRNTFAKSGHPLTEAQGILLIGALAVWIPAIRADERRKALTEAAVMFEQSDHFATRYAIAYAIRAMIDRKEPT